MERTQALEHFRERYVGNTVLDQLETLDRYFWQQKDDLRQALQTNFVSLCQKIMDRQTRDPKPVGFINLSLLRTSLLEENTVYRWDVYGQEWYGDTLDVGGCYHADWAFDYLKQAKVKLEVLRRPYMGAVIRQDVGVIMQQETIFFHAYVVALLRYMLRGVEAIPEFQAVIKASTFYLCVGEYFDFCDIAYLAYTNPPNANKIKRRLKEGDSAYKPMKETDFSQGDYSFSNLSFSDARGSDFDHGNLYSAQCVGTDFRGCRLEGADLKHSNISDADFSSCRLRQADLGWAEGGAGVDDEEGIKSFLGVNFRNSDLTDTFFTGADLRRADFRGATFHETDFQDARLKEAIFYTKDKSQLDLTPEQIAEIHWVEEGQT